MNKIWLKNYYPDIPHEVEVPENANLVDDFFDVCSKYKDNVAFENMNIKISYSKLQELSERFAAYLTLGLKLKKGDKIALMMPNILQYPVAMFGALIAGLTIVNVNPLYTPRELSYVLKDSEAKAIVILENFANVLEQASKEVNVEHKIITKFGDMFPVVKGSIVNFVVKYIKKMVPNYSIKEALNFKEILKNDFKFEKINVNGNDIAFLQYTGGTTGRSKGAILTHYNMSSNSTETVAWITPAIEEGKEIIITALPLYHIFSLLANCFTYMKIGGNNVLITNPRDLKNFISYIKNKKFTAITGVDTLFNALVNHKDFSSVDFSALKLTLGGGMAVHESVAAKWKKITDKPIIEAYGLTEASPAVCINPIFNDKYNGSIGLPISSTEVSIRTDDGEELGVDEVGELWVKGPQVMQGYWNKEEETKEVLTEEGWLKTGDVARIDKDGFVFIVDRKKDMIIVSGFNVYPSEIEEVISKIEGVLEVAVVGVPHDVKGETIKACIVKSDENITEDFILQECRKELTAYKIPHIIEFKESLPKTNVGKILRRALRDGDAIQHNP